MIDVTKWLELNTPLIDAIKARVTFEGKHYYLTPESTIRVEYIGGTQLRFLEHGRFTVLEIPEIHKNACELRYRDAERKIKEWRKKYVKAVDLMRMHERFSFNDQYAILKQDMEEAFKEWRVWIKALAHIQEASRMDIESILKNA